MELHALRPAKGSTKKRKRIARGQGSGRGGTSTRGHKGAKSRSGYKSKRAFEGGQMPLQMRLPKRGFKNPNRTEYVVFNLEQLGDISAKIGDEITVKSLYEGNFIKKNDLVKILGRGELDMKVSVSVHAISQSAKKGIEEKGGSVNIL